MMQLKLQWINDNIITGQVLKHLDTSNDVTTVT